MARYASDAISTYDAGSNARIVAGLAPGIHRDGASGMLRHIWDIPPGDSRSFLEQGVIVRNAG